MRRKLVVGNWKMNGNLLQNKALISAYLQELQGLSEADFAVCVPYTYLFQAQQLLSGTAIKWGSQNVSQFLEGAYTSSISASMIAEFGCSYAIVGHSERRYLSHESNEKAAIRVTRAVNTGITPIYCVGETQLERQAGHAKKIVEAQVLAICNLPHVDFEHAKAVNMVIAYEPVWAIGTGQAASAEDAQEMHSFIRVLFALRDEEFAKKVRIIYGGSLTPANACALLTMPDIDGGLIGRSALNAVSFGQIAKIACNTGACLVDTE